MFAFFSKRTRKNNQLISEFTFKRHL